MVIKNIKLVLLLTVLYVSLPSLSWTEEACRSVFNEILEKLKKVDISQYKGQEGYVRFAEEFKETQNMTDIFDKVFETLDKKQMRVLRWKKFQGTVSEFYKLMDKILHDDNSIRTEYQGLGGFIKLVKKYFSNDFFKAYSNVSSVLGNEQMIEFGWKKLKKTILNFNRFAKPLLNKDSSIKDEYKGQAGYIRFVEEFEGTESMSYVFTEVSKVLGSVKMKKLQWQKFYGTPEGFKELRHKILNKDGSIREEYKGMSGYAEFAEKYYEGDMEKAYQNVSAVLGGGSQLMKQLSWQQYQGQASGFNKKRHEILKDGSIREEYKGMSGYAKFAEEHFEGNMEKAYHNVSAILGGVGSQLMKQLSWQQYQGQVSGFNKKRHEILKDGSIREEYKGMSGYAKFAEKYFEGDMQKAYINVSAVLGGGSQLMKQLSWQAYQGQASGFNKKRHEILKDGLIREEYKGMSGYAKFAEEHFEGNMQKTYKNVSAILGGVVGSQLMKQLAWQAYKGQVSDFKELRYKILNKNDSIREKYKGRDGYVKFAEKYFEGDMQKAYQNISAVLGGRSSHLMKQLSWQKYQGQVLDFKDLSDKILNKDGSIREEYKGMSGYAKFAEEYFEGNMEKAYQNVSAVIGGVGFHLMKQLSWQQYQGQVSSFKDLSDKILNKDGLIKKEYKGMFGCAEFAEKYFEGDMKKAYKNVSAVLGGFREMRRLNIGWKNFQGTVKQFKDLKELFKNRAELEGEKGQTRVATDIFNGNKKRAYNMVSALKEYLLGSEKAFQELDWRKQ